MNAYEFLQMCNPDGTHYTILLFLSFTRHSVGEPELHREFKKNVVENMFVSPERLSQARGMFEKAQRVRKVLARCARKSRARYLRDRSFTNTDLSLEPIDQHPIRHRIVLRGQQGAYDFYLGDLLHHWRAQLLAQQWRRPCPRAPTNPYTNEDIPAVQFIRVYAVAVTEGFRMHDALTMLYRSQGDMEYFCSMGEVILREWAVRNYAEEGDPNELYDELLSIKQQLARALPNVYLHDDPPHDVKRRIVERLHPIIAAYGAWAHTSTPAASAYLGRCFYATTERINLSLEGQRYGRVIKKRVHGRWTDVWLV